MPQNNFNRSGNGFFQMANNRTTTTRQMFLNELRFSAAKSIRTSTMILACFNIVAAFATALGIICDSYFRERRNNKNYKFKYAATLRTMALWNQGLLTAARRNGFSFVPEGEVYPLVLSVGILIQSATFAGAQSTGLDSFLGRGCTTIAQLMLPGTLAGRCC